MTVQGPRDVGIRGPGSAVEGQSIPVEVSIDGVDHIIVSDGQPGSDPVPIPIGPGGSAVIPANPNWVAGTVLIVFTPTVPVRAIIIEIVATSP